MSVTCVNLSLCTCVWVCVALITAQRCLGLRYPHLGANTEPSAADCTTTVATNRQSTWEPKAAPRIGIGTMEDKAGTMAHRTFPMSLTTANMPRGTEQHLPSPTRCATLATVGQHETKPVAMQRQIWHRSLNGRTETLCRVGAWA